MLLASKMNLFYGRNFTEFSRFFFLFQIHYLFVFCIKLFYYVFKVKWHHKCQHQLYLCIYVMCATFSFFLCQPGSNVMVDVMTMYIENCVSCIFVIKSQRKTNPYFGTGKNHATMPCYLSFSLGKGRGTSVPPLKTFKQFKGHLLSISPCDALILDTPSHLW